MDKKPLSQSLSNHSPRILSENSKYAAVAIIICSTDRLSEVFLIKRTIHENDPWSGQVGLPGGHYESDDETLLNTAIRETEEETNIKLNQKNYLSQINDQQGYASGGKINLTVRPFVFVINSQPNVVMNYEVDQTYWLPIEHFIERQNHIYFTPMANYSSRPGVKLDDSSVLWGMTYRILTDFFNTANINTPFVGDYDQTR